MASSITPGEIATYAPRVPWDKFVRSRFNWRSGEHIGLIGPTGQGKTTMLTALLPLHKYNIVFATKPRDETMDELISKGYEKLARWQSLDPQQHPKRVIWPDATRLDSDDLQRSVFGDAFNRIYREGDWTLAVDETWWFSEVLNMDAPIKKYLLQGRSLGISLLAGTQRPAWVPRELYTSCTHLFFWRTNDADDLKSLSGIGWRDARLIREVVANLEQYQALYVNTRTGVMLRTKVQKGYVP